MQVHVKVVAALLRHSKLAPCRRCTADCGWVTGHSYLAYGPLLNGATNVVFEGTPTYPTPARCWEVVAKYKVGLGQLCNSNRGS